VYYDDFKVIFLMLELRLELRILGLNVLRLGYCVELNIRKIISYIKTIDFEYACVLNRQAVRTVTN
jgi:hypothetical protein